MKVTQISKKISIYLKFLTEAFLYFALGPQIRFLSWQINKGTKLNLKRGFLKYLIWVGKPCKFYRGGIIFDWAMVIFPFCFILTPKRVFDPCGPPGGVRVKIFFPCDFPLSNRSFGPKMNQKIDFACDSFDTFFRVTTC